MSDILQLHRKFRGNFLDAEGVEWEGYRSGEYATEGCVACGGSIANEQTCVRRVDDSGPVYHASCTRVDGVWYPWPGHRIGQGGTRFMSMQDTTGQAIAAALERANRLTVLRTEFDWLIAKQKPERAWAVLKQMKDDEGMREQDWSPEAAAEHELERRLDEQA